MSLSQLIPASETKPRGRLLLVDDEENILRSIRRVLRRGEWEIETASNGDEGLQALERFKPDVIVSDFRMPGMNGVEFLSRVKLLSPRTQRIMLTGQADQQAIEEAINRSEVFRFVGKPWNDSQLVLTVKSAFEQHWLLAENERLHEMTAAQNEELKLLNADLETRVALRPAVLSRAKREWELAFDSIDNPLALVRTSDMSVRRANVAYARMAKQSVTDLPADIPCHQFLFGRDTVCPNCPLRASLESGKGERAEIVEGGRTYVVATYPMGDDGRAVATYHDVTEEHAMTRALIESEKMAAVGQLAGGVAHEINNPLGGILAFSQLMKRDAGRSPDDLESLGLIEEAALRCKRIVQSLLKFSRRSSKADRRPFDVSRCVEDAVVLFKAQLKSHPRVKLDLQLKNGVPEVHGDPAQLAQVILNLLQNGLYAVHGDGLLTVETGSVGDRAFIRVTDTGTGIEPEHLGHIFEPTFTTKPPGEGTGLGLSISYRIVEDHGGSFSVDSKPGEGSRFTVHLPIPLQLERQNP